MPKTKQLMDFMASDFTSAYNVYWIGLDDLVQEDTFVWTDGSTYGTVTMHVDGQDAWPTGWSAGTPLYSRDDDKHEWKPWQPDQPNDYGRWANQGQDCVIMTMWHPETGPKEIEWEDQHCNRRGNPYICQASGPVGLASD